MSAASFLRFVFGTAIAIVLLVIVLPLIGVPRSHFLPPWWVYNAAKGTATGTVTKVYHEESQNPFKIGDKMYFIDYEFYAKPKTADGRVLGPAQWYTGTYRIADNSGYTTIKEGQLPPIKYEITYPEINGISADGYGQACRGPNTFVSGWLLWVGAALVLGGIFSAILSRFGAKEDI